MMHMKHHSSPMVDVLLSYSMSVEVEDNIAHLRIADANETVSLLRWV